MEATENNKFSEFRRKVKIYFSDSRMLKQAFTHRSYINEDKTLTVSDSNERLEFLGDSVLQLAVTDFLYRKYPKCQEGELTQFRSALVNTTIFADVAEKLGMREYLLLAKGATFETSTEYRHILADAFEAFIGALYLDQGYSTAQGFIVKHLFPHIEEIMEKRLWRDWKTVFQEKAQKHALTTPIYRVLSELGVPHDKTFVVAVLIGEEFVAEGTGKSKKEAERQAAGEALQIKGWLD